VSGSKTNVWGLLRVDRIPLFRSKTGVLQAFRACAKAGGYTRRLGCRVSMPVRLGVRTSSVLTCIGALGTPSAERGPSLECIYRVSLTVDHCEGYKINSLKKIISQQPVEAPKKSGGPGHVPSVPIG